MVRWDTLVTWSNSALCIDSLRRKTIRFLLDSTLIDKDILVRAKVELGLEAIGL